MITKLLHILRVWKEFNPSCRKGKQLWLGGWGPERSEIKLLFFSVFVTNLIACWFNPFPEDYCRNYLYKLKTVSWSIILLVNGKKYKKLIVTAMSYKEMISLEFALTTLDSPSGRQNFTHITLDQYIWHCIIAICRYTQCIHSIAEDCTSLNFEQSTYDRQTKA